MPIDPGKINPTELKSGLQTKIIGQKIEYYPELPSTNLEARKLAEGGAGDGTIVIAETQSAGRGRRGRAWESPVGGLWLTIILRPKVPLSEAPKLTLMAGVVIAGVLREEFDLKATLKWPNDVRIRDKKICGILTELSAERDTVNYILLGLGININIALNDLPTELQNTVTSLQEQLDGKVDRINFTQQILLEFENEYLSFSKSPAARTPEILKAWRQYSDTLGRNVRIETISGEITGLAADIANDGALIVHTENGEEHRIIAGDCIYLEQ